MAYSLLSRGLMPVRPAALAALSLLLAAPAIAQSAIFELHVEGKPVGKDSFVLAPAKQGFKLTSRYAVRYPGNEFDLKNEFKLDPSYNFLEGTTADTATLTQTSYLPNKPRTELSIARFQAGSQDAAILLIAPDIIILPAFDAGATQIALLHAVAHPSGDNAYKVVIPAAGGASSSGGRRGAPPPSDSAAAPSGLLPGNHVYDGTWLKGIDVTGTLDGKPLTLHTYRLALGDARWIFFADDANNLMQVNVTALHASYIHTGFQLDTIPRPH